MDSRSTSNPTIDAATAFWFINSLVTIVADSALTQDAMAIYRQVAPSGFVNDLARKIRRYIKAYSANAKPIQWKYSNPNRRIRSNELTATGH
jgi:hypothetical protein